MKRMSAHLLLVAVFAVVLGPARASDKDADLLSAVKLLRSQQAEITDNEAKIETKLGELAETVRVARIFMSRSGGGHKAVAPK